MSRMKTSVSSDSTVMHAAPDSASSTACCTMITSASSWVVARSALSIFVPLRSSTDVRYLPVTTRLCKIQYPDSPSLTNLAHIMSVSLFLPRDTMLSAVYAVVVCLCVSVTLRYCIKTAKLRVTQIMLNNSPGTSFLTPKFTAKFEWLVI